MKNLETLSNRKNTTAALLIDGKPATRAELKRVGIVAQPVAIDEEYENWKRANGLTAPMSRQAYVAEFQPCSW